MQLIVNNSMVLELECFQSLVTIMSCCIVDGVLMSVWSSTSVIITTPTPWLTRTLLWNILARQVSIYCNDPKYSDRRVVGKHCRPLSDQGIHYLPFHVVLLNNCSIFFRHLKFSNIYGIYVKAWSCLNYQTVPNILICQNMSVVVF